MSTKYSIVCRNNSTSSGSFCLFQQQPNIANMTAWSLAWMVQTSTPGTDSTFEWTIDYSFVWSETNTLIPGVTFGASQTLGADLTTANQVTLTRSPEELSLTFANLGAGPNPGSLHLIVDPSVPAHTVSVGIAMSGAGTFAIGAQPNTDIIFTPHPTYWLTFGSFTPGQVLDPSKVTNALEVTFPTDVFALHVTLDKNHNWTTSPR